MATYVLRRLLQMIPTTLGAIFLLHLITSVGIQVTANPVRALFGDRQPTEAQMQTLADSLGLGDKCLDQVGNPCFGLYLDRLNGIFFHFDFGVNLANRQVTDIIATALPFTLRLVVIAIIFEAVIGIVAGLMAGLKPDKFIDYLVKISTVLLIAIPSFVLGAAVQTFFDLKLGNWARDQAWIPDWFSSGVMNPVYSSDYTWASMVVPGMVLGSLSLATVARLTRTSILENSRSDYVRTAKAKGLSPRRVVGVHTLRNSLIPVVTYLGVDLGALLSGSVVTEGIFGIPGLGREIFRATVQNNPAVVVGVATFLVLVYLFINLIVDVLYAVLDPRIRYD